MSTERTPYSSGPEAYVPEPTIFATTIEHVRRTPWRRAFRHRSYLWAGDLDDLAAVSDRRGSWFTGRVEARDHLGEAGLSLRENLRRFLALHDIDLGDATVRLAAHPRAWGHCFNPISVWWCTTATGAVLATVVEVHNTYGDRHAYLLRAATDGEVEKQMYVSPFHGVDGAYRVTATLSEDRVHVAVALRTSDGAHFDASLAGRAVPGHRFRAALSGPRDALLIRVHGIAIWLRRLPIRPRPTHLQEGVQS